MSELPRGTVTFLFTDVEGSTRLLRQLGRERYGQMLADHDRLLRAAFASGGGREIDNQGDAFFVAFRSATAAVTAAEEAQRKIAGHPWPSDAELQVRIGIHTGEPLAGETRYIGLGVHRAARISALGHGGQVLLSKTTHDLLEDEELPDVDFKDLGEHRLKDLPRPERIYQLVAAGLRRDFPALKALDAQPAEASPFTGHEKELAEAAREAIAEPRPWRRRNRILLPVLAGVVAAAVAIPVFALGGAGESELAARDTETAGRILPPNSVGVIDPATNRVMGPIRVGDGPLPIVAGHGAVWVGNLDENTISRINPETREVVSTIGVGHAPNSLAVGEDAVWVTNGYAGTLTRVNPATDQVDPSIKIRAPIEPQFLNTSPVSGGSGWMPVNAEGDTVLVSDRNSLTLIEVDPASKQIVNRIPDLDVQSIAVGEDGVWVIDYAPKALVRLDPVTGTEDARVQFDLDASPKALAIGNALVWVANTNQNFVWRVDGLTELVERTVQVGEGPAAIAVGHGAVWVGNWLAGTVTRLNPATAEVEATIKVGRQLGGLAVDDEAVWVTVFAP